MRAHDLRWLPSRHARRLLTLAALSLVLGLLLGRVDVVAFAAVCLAPYALARRHPWPQRATVQVRTSTQRCFEGEPVDVTVLVGMGQPVDQLRVGLAPGPGVQVDGRRAALGVVGVDAIEMPCTVRMPRWGTRQIGTVQVDALVGGRLVATRLQVRDTGAIAVFPQPAAMARLSSPAGRTDRTGDHIARTSGPGVEFTGIRPFVLGDSQRRINWAVSTRRRALHVNESAAERAIDVVVAVDAFGDVGPPGASSLDLTVRGATGVVRHFLRTHDRVGLVAIGGWLRWITADVGDRQFYRVAETILDVLGRESFIDPDLERIPRTALPPGAVVVFFSPLLDPRAIRAVQDLRGRGHSVTIVDVLTTEPAIEKKVAHDRIALRLWRLERAALRHQFAGVGIVVVGWSGTEPLDALLEPSLRRPIPARA